MALLEVPQMVATVEGPTMVILLLSTVTMAMRGPVVVQLLVREMEAGLQDPRPAHVCITVSSVCDYHHL